MDAVARLPNDALTPLLNRLPGSVHSFRKNNSLYGANSPPARCFVVAFIPRYRFPNLFFHAVSFLVGPIVYPFVARLNHGCT